MAFCFYRTQSKHPELDIQIFLQSKFHYFSHLNFTTSLLSHRKTQPKLIILLISQIYSYLYPFIYFAFHYLILPLFSSIGNPTSSFIVQIKSCIIHCFSDYFNPLQSTVKCTSVSSLTTSVNNKSSFIKEGLLSLFVGLL